MKYVSLDIETTGLNPNPCKTIQIAAVIDDLVTPIDELPRFVRFIHWENVSFEPYALNLHLKSGLLARYLEEKNKPNFVQAVTDLDAFLNEHIPLVSPRDKYNFAGKNLSGFDLHFIAENGDGNENVNKFLAKIRHRIIDPATSFTDFFKDSSCASLDDCKRRAGVEGGLVTHDALDDALDVVKVVRVIAEKNKGLSNG